MNVLVVHNFYQQAGGEDQVVAAQSRPGAGAGHGEQGIGAVERRGVRGGGHVGGLVAVAD